MNLLSRLFKGPRYERRGDEIVFHKFPFGQLRIPKDGIKAWTVIPEMGADAVKIELSDGQVLLLTDKRNDLIDALKALAPQRKLGDEIDRLG